MRRIALLGVLAAMVMAFAIPAQAAPPERYEYTYDFTIVSTNACPDAYVDVSATVEGMAYFDNDGNLVRTIDHVKETATYGGPWGTTFDDWNTFTDTWYFDADGNPTRVVTTGQYGKATVPGEGIVFMDIGRVMFDFTTYDLFVAGRHDWMGNFEDLCLALGGTPG